MVHQTGVLCMANDLWGLRGRIMHRGESEGVCVRRSIGLFVSPFVVGDGFCGLYKVVIVIESPEDGLSVIHGSLVAVYICLVPRSKMCG
jgi:hypothetical protein